MKNFTKFFIIKDLNYKIKKKKIDSRSKLQIVLCLFLPFLALKHIILHIFFNFFLFFILTFVLTRESELDKIRYQDMLEEE